MEVPVGEFFPDGEFDGEEIELDVHEVSVYDEVHTANVHPAPRARHLRNISRCARLLLQGHIDSVGAQNFVLYVGTWGRRSQWCNRLRWIK
jgi:hypothetical protein